MRFWLLGFSLLFLSAYVSQQSTVTTKNTATGYDTAFDPKGAAKNRVKLALLYLQKDNMQQAKQNLDKALEYQPNDPEIFRIFAYYYHRVNENEKAEEYYKKSLSIDDENADTYNNYGTFLCSLKRYEEAEQAFLDAIKQSSYTGVSNTYENAAICAEQANKLDKALYYYEYALSHNPRKSYINLDLAKININQKAYKKARLNLFNFQKRSVDTAQSLWLWIRLSDATGKNASLKKYAGKLLSNFPDSQQALDYLNHDYK